MHVYVICMYGVYVQRACVGPNSMRHARLHTHECVITSNNIESRKGIATDTKPRAETSDQILANFATPTK